MNITIHIAMIMLLLLGSIQLTAGTYSGGAGTAGNPYQIASLADLIELSGTSADWAAGIYFIQTAHIDASSTSSLNAGAGFSPIGNSTTQFQGSYDGQSHTIMNLYINRSSTQNIGLFGSILGAGDRVKNVGLLNVNINGGQNTGGLVGYNDAGKVSNCFSTGSVGGTAGAVGGLVGSNYYANSTISTCYSTCSVTGLANVGGLVGFGLQCTVSNSYSTGVVSVSSSSAGGFIGRNTAGTVINCYSLGNVTGISGTETSLGGFCGYNAGSITYCYSTGSVNFGSTKGFIGFNEWTGTFSNNYFDQTTSGQTSGTGATAKTTAEMKTQATFTGWNFTVGDINWVMSSSIAFAGYPTSQWTGGYSVEPTINNIASLPNLVWVAENSARWAGNYTQTADITTWTTPGWDGNKGWTPIGNSGTEFTGYYNINGDEHTISNLYINRPSTQYIGLFGSISASPGGVRLKNTGVINFNFTGQYAVGGLVGRNYPTLSNCYSTGTISGTGNIGGLIGLNYGIVSNCYSTCNVSGLNTVGGLIGYNHYWDASISNCYATGSVSGTDNAGGFVGANDEGPPISNSYCLGNVTRTSGTGVNFGGFCGSNWNTASIGNCYSVGKVYESQGTKWSSLDKGFAGFTGGSATFTNNFYDQTTSEQTTGTGATAKTTAQMKTQATFTTPPSAWNFTPTTGVWNIQSGAYISYPYLQAITYDAPGTIPAVNPIPGLEQQGPISTITFNTEGGSAIAPIIQEEGTAVTRPADPTKAGYTFQGWVPDVPTIMPVDDVTCIAQWTTCYSGQFWTARAAAGASYWSSVTYGNGLFVAVATSGSNQVMSSPDGITWTARTAAGASYWSSVTYGNGLFVAVAYDGTNRVMTSPDGITWTARSAAEDGLWSSVTYGNGLFVAVSSLGTNRVMTSPDGITWTVRTAAGNSTWYSVTYGSGLFVAVATSGSNRVMTSPDGITWTDRTASEVNGWRSVTYGNGLFVAVAYDGINRVMTSPDGITWTARTPAESNHWYSVTHGNGLFVAVAYYGTNRVMTSPDGITWTARSATEPNGWYSVTYGNGRFVAVAENGTNRVMTSDCSIPNPTSTITFNTNGGNAIAPITQDEGTAVTAPANPTKAGYTFAGWVPAIPATMPVDDVTCVAQWEAIPTSTITFDVAGGTPAIAPITQDEGTAVTPPANPTKAGLTFQGWVPAVPATMPVDDVTCVAQWSATSSCGQLWTSRSATEANIWRSVTYGNGLFVAVAENGTNRVMTSPDGITWTARTAAEANPWRAVTYGNGLFVAVAYFGTHSVMTSPDGITWTAR
ncbi:MAG: GLUG motif-containing protein, partial [Bacteroidota bacterium]